MTDIMNWIAHYDDHTDLNKVENRNSLLTQRSVAGMKMREGTISDVMGMSYANLTYLLLLFTYSLLIIVSFTNSVYQVSSADCNDSFPICIGCCEIVFWWSKVRTVSGSRQCPFEYPDSTRYDQLHSSNAGNRPQMQGLNW